MILIWVIRFKNNLAELCHFFMKTSNSKIRKDNEKSWTNQKNWPWQAPWQIIFERFCLSPHIIVLNILVANSFDRKSTKYTLKSRQFYPFYVNLVTILCQFYVNFVPKGLHEFANIFLNMGSMYAYILLGKARTGCCVMSKMLDGRTGWVMAG